MHGLKILLYIICHLLHEGVGCVYILSLTPALTVCVCVCVCVCVRVRVRVMCVYACVYVCVYVYVCVCMCVCTIHILPHVQMYTPVLVQFYNHLASCMYIEVPCSFSLCLPIYSLSFFQALSEDGFLGRGFA